MRAHVRVTCPFITVRDEPAARGMLQGGAGAASGRRPRRRSRLRPGRRHRRQARAGEAEGDRR